MEAPAKHPTLPKSWPVALASMLTEVDLIDFVPTFTEIPQLLQSPSLDFSTWREQARIRFVMSEVCIQQATRMCTPEGVYVVVQEKVTDPIDERVKNVRIPSGYVLSPGRDRVQLVLVLGEEHFSSISTVNAPLPPGASIPRWVLNIVLGWLFPSIVRSMFKTAASIFNHPEYTKRHEKDKLGLYARVGKAEEDAVKREHDTKRKLRIYRPEDRPHQNAFRFGSLAARLASLTGST